MHAALDWALLLSSAVMVLLEAIQGDVFLEEAADVHGKCELARPLALLWIALRRQKTAVMLILSLTIKVVE